MKLNNLKIVYAGSSQYGTYRVVDMIYHDRPARLLFGDDGSPQSGMSRDNDPELLFDYNQRFLEMMLSHPPNNALVIGGGVLMLPKAAYQLFPHSNIDVVETDELLIQLARDYFDLPDDPRLSVYIDDGLSFVKSTTKRYDMIVIDAFHGYVVPPHLIAAQAAQHYQKALAPGGIVTINFISGYRPKKSSLAHDIIHNFSDSFKYIEVYQSDPDDTPGREQNMLLAASNQKLSLDYLQTKNIKR